MTTWNGIVPSEWARIDRSGSSYTDRPSKIEPTYYRVRRDVANVRNLSYAPQLSSEFDKAIGSFVPLICFMSHPSAIARLVITVVVDSIERCTDWLVSHIRKKTSECFPRLAHIDSSSAVIPITNLSWIRAASDHLFPAFIRLCLRHSVFNKPGRCAFLSPAAATVADSFAKLTPLYYAFFSTATSTQPLTATTRSISDSVNDFPITECLSCQIVGGLHV